MDYFLGFIIIVLNLIHQRNQSAMELHIDYWIAQETMQTKDAPVILYLIL